MYEVDDVPLTVIQVNCLISLIASPEFCFLQISEKHQLSIIEEDEIQYTSYFGICMFICVLTCILITLYVGRIFPSEVIY